MNFIFSEYKRLDDLLIDLIIRRKFPGIRTLYHARLNSFYVIHFLVIMTSSDSVSISVISQDG